MLGQGQTQGRVPIHDILRRPGAIGVGALENLEGEVTIFEGHSWLSIGTPKAFESSDRQAALLAVAYLPQWIEIVCTTEIGAKEFDTVIRARAEDVGIDTEKPFPFSIEGRLTVEAHVVRGACPHAGATKEAGVPERISFSTSNAAGTLVGFYADHSEGSLTHHGSKTHVHVLLFDDTPRSGHVDSVSVAPGSIIRLPKTQ